MSSRLLYGGYVAALLLALTPAHAIGFDLTGTWVGRVSCRGVVEGQKQTLTRSPSTLLIMQSPALQVSADGIFYNGSEIAQPSRPTHGEAVLIRCDTSPEFGGEFGGEFARLKVATKPEKGTGSLRGTSLRTGVVLAGSVYSCKWGYKRISLSVPALEGCQ